MLERKALENSEKFEALKNNEAFRDDLLNLLSALLHHSGETEFYLRGFEEDVCRERKHPNAEIRGIDTAANATLYFCQVCDFYFERDGIPKHIPSYLQDK